MTPSMPLTDEQHARINDAVSASPPSRCPSCETDVALEWNPIEAPEAPGGLELRLVCHECDHHLGVFEQ